MKRPESGDTLSHYRITARLGAGGMGEVYRATDETLGRDVAIKVLPEEVAKDAERLARFKREAHLLAALNHTNIASIYGLEEADGTPFLVLELVEGEDLSERLKRGAIPLDEALAIAKQIAEALEEAHEHGIVHRDLKPANIKLTPAGKVKVLDFGLAKASAEDGSATSSPDVSHSPTLSVQGTRAGLILGTAAYMAPEQAAGRAVDRRADIWSFGVVLYEMLAGRRLFEGETVSHVLAGVLKDEPDFSALPAGTPARILRLLRRCLRKRPRERLQAIGDARIEIDEVLAGATDEPAAHAVDGASPGRRSAWPTRVALALLALASVALGVRVALDRSAKPKLLRASLLPPAGVSFYLEGIRPGPPALSPDGRAVVFTGASKDGRHTLWVRAVDKLEPRELPSTEGAQYPFWSTDSQQIGFFTDSQLKKIPLAGGPPVAIADVVIGKGGSWSRRGVIVFAAAFNVPLSMVSENGGKVEPVTTFAPNGEDTSHRHPRFLPDGRRFLFVAQRGSKPSELRAGSIDGSPAVPLFETQYDAEYANGWLLFVRESSLLAQPFDPDSLKLSGAATLLVESVFRLTGTSIAGFSASREGTLAYLTGVLEERSRLVWRDREGKEIGRLGEPGLLGSPRLSPDGQSLAVEVVDSKSGFSHLWIYDLRRGVRSRFALGDGDQSGPVWSPDGQTIAFATNSSGQGRPLQAAPVAGTEPPRIVSTGKPLALLPTGWSPDGRFLVAEQLGAGGKNDLLVVPAKGGEPQPLIANPEVWEHSGAVSPDGRWLAFDSNESGRYEVYVTSFPTPGRKWQVSQSGGRDARWRGDGRELLYNNGSAFHSAVVDGSGPSFQVGAGRRLFDLPFKLDDGVAYDVTRDGQRFLLVEPMADNEIAPITLVQDWNAQLGRAMAGSR